MEKQVITILKASCAPDATDSTKRKEELKYKRWCQKCPEYIEGGDVGCFNCGQPEWWNGPVQPTEENFYSFSPDNDYEIVWGARTIYDQKRYSFDVVHDRTIYCGSKEDMKRLAAWLYKEGFPKLKDELKKRYISSRSGETIEIDGDGFKLKASPNNSYGYLYMMAHSKET